MNLPRVHPLLGVCLVVAAVNAVCTFLIGTALLLHLFTRLHP